MVHAPKGRFAFSVLASALILLAACAHKETAPLSERASEQQELVTKARFVAENFTGEPDLAWVRQNVGRAKGVLIIPQLIKGGFVFGGSGGTGVLLARNRNDGTWSYPAFYNLGSATFGLQIGGEVSEIVLLIMTNKGMNALLSPNFKLGGDVSVAAGPVGVGAKAATADVIAFSRSKGLYGGLNIEGAVIAPRSEWNEAYYGEAVTSTEIVMNRTVENPSADSLRAAVANMTNTATTTSQR